MIKNIIFDFDGTIGDTAENTIRLVNSLAEEKGYHKLTENDIHRLMNMSLREALKEFHIPIWKVPWLLRTARPLIYDSIDKCNPFDGMTEVIESLAENHNLYIFTSNAKDTVEKFLGQHNLSRNFLSVTSEKNLFGKGRGLKKLLRRNDLNKDECIYIGDEVRDLEACQKVGIKCISVTWGINSKEFLDKQNPDFLVDRPEEILEVVEGIT